MTEAEIREAARRFINAWKGKGYEKGDTHRFWMSLLSDVLGLNNVAEKIEFEKEVVINGQTKFIDAYIPETRVLIEQKSLNKDLNKPIPQSGGISLTPFEQAKNYANNLPVDESPRWIITCNFAEFQIYDMNKPGSEPELLLLENLQTEVYRLQFLLNKKVVNISKEMQVSIKAGELVGKLYDAFLKEYKEPENEHTLKSLNALCVRLVFCLYAEDAGIFGNHGMFHDYLLRFEVRDLRKALIELFQVLDTKPENRDPYMDDDLAAFPYVNGGLFSDNNIEIPHITEDIKALILQKASEDFDWSEISPTIFGAVFESTLNPETRRSGGMHYTSIENIHKVIDPLFLDDLKAELEEIRNIPVVKTKKFRLEEFQNKISNLNFLDPACGSGNFLTESYISLRKIENEILKLKMEVDKKQLSGQIAFGEAGNTENPIKVSIRQFFGIEINDFAVTVAKTALWIAESQMIKATEDVIHMNIDFLPLKSYANIIEGNALQLDWSSIVQPHKLSYIIGNPPFVGMKEQTDTQKEDMKAVIPIKKFKQLDYVACWYFKAAEYIKETNIEVAFVSSNSITQGEQALTIWKPLLTNYKVIINFAHTTFVWDSEANQKAHVHCVIIGFSMHSRNKKMLITDSNIKYCNNINQYLTPFDNLFIDKIGKPINKNVEQMTKGAQLIDGGNFVIASEEEYQSILQKEPELKKYIRQYYNARDLLNNGESKYAFYLEYCSPKEINSSPTLKKVVSNVYKYRSENESKSTNVLKDTPSHYFQPQVPNGKSVVIPVVSSQNRRYIPMCFMPEGMVYTNALFFIDNASIYTFGILTSNVHMAWMRLLCGRMKSDFRYSNTLVYNTFPWPKVTEEQKLKIEETAQGILDARALYPESSLADLYDPLLMPIKLKKAHQANDRAVMQAYGLSVKNTSEADCVAHLMQMYQELTQ